jgi:hypothetical protein
MTLWRIANKLRGECSYHTPIRVVLSTKKLGKSDLFRCDENSGLIGDREGDHRNLIRYLEFRCKLVPGSVVGCWRVALLVLVPSDIGAC